jgi:hypothetical protein
VSNQATCHLSSEGIKTMPEYADIYVLCRRRERAIIDQFLEQMIPDRVEAADEYFIPPYSANPTLIFTDASSLIGHCCKHLNQDHGIYWRSSSGRKLEHAMVFFNADGSIVLGVSTDSVDQELADWLCGQLMTLPSAKCAYVTHEDTLPDSAHGFIDLVRRLPCIDHSMDQTTIRAGRARAWPVFKEG